jgi:hypothetical protein
MKKILIVLLMMVLVPLAAVTPQANADYDDRRFVYAVVVAALDDVEYDVATLVCETYYGYNGLRSKKKFMRKQIRLFAEEGISERDTRIGMRRAMANECPYYL